MKRTIPLIAVAALSLSASFTVLAGWSDYLDTLRGAVSSPDDATPGVDLTNTEMVGGLKEALQKGTQFAVESLGKQGGYLDSPEVRIPVPDSLSWVEKSLRTLGQDELADAFVASMNHAAEQAVPEAADIFGQAIQDMSVDDARAILTGPDDSATQYFRTHTEDVLTERLLPIVRQSMGKTGVTASYKAMVDRAGGLTSLLSSDATDLDGYVTGQALDGLFKMIAREEQQIRANPVARTSDLMKKVFGAYTR